LPFSCHPSPRAEDLLLPLSLLFSPVIPEGDLLLSLLLLLPFLFVIPEGDLLLFLVVILREPESFGPDLM
jgi:hypothetical protein